MICVEVRGSFSQAVKMFADKVLHEGLMRELKQREYFLTRSQKRKIKDKRAVTRMKKKFKPDVDPRCRPRRISQAQRSPRGQGFRIPEERGV